MTSSGRRLQLAKVLGKGGEGTIYHVEGDGSIAVKLYTDGKGLQRRDKINAMISDRLHERTPFVAFPIETVIANGSFAGFTMRKAVGAKPMHQLCTPGDRKTEFPDANFRFLVRVALNFTRAVASINNLGVVIGDINESGALVDQKGMITVIDSDSFQYRNGLQLFRCLVGKPEYTPTELQGQPFEKVDRTVNHDAFGLAVIIFEVLFMGRHPFSGVYKGVGEQPPISKAIQEGRFAYAQQKSLTQMEPPPHVPVLADIPMDIAAAFERAFGSSASRTQIRPMPAEWVPLLERMEQGIIECKANPAHYYSKTAPNCPWCRFEAGYGSILFVAHQPISRSTFNIDYVLSKIERIAGPGPAPDLTSILLVGEKLKPSQLARDFKSRVRARQGAGLAVAGMALVLMFSGMGWGFFLLIPAGILFFGEVSGAAEIQRQRSRAESVWKSSIESWNRNAGSAKFDDKKGGLLRTAASYRALPGVERDMLLELERKKRDLQMKKHLEAHKLSNATIESIRDGRKMTLRSFGIETAWDVKTPSVRAVPGFGPVLTKNLMDWRLSIERRFTFNPSLPTDPAEIAKVRAEIAMRRNAMETELFKGVADLETARAETLARRRNTKQYEAAYLAYLQAEVDTKYLLSRLSV
jgi:DNA-binding helix-hairpin-helix protein with protein kinase domain